MILCLCQLFILLHGIAHGFSSNDKLGQSTELISKPYQQKDYFSMEQTGKEPL